MKTILALVVIIAGASLAGAYAINTLTTFDSVAFLERKARESRAELELNKEARRVIEMLPDEEKAAAARCVKAGGDAYECVLTTAQAYVRRTRQAQ